MSNFFARQGGAARNELHRSASALIGIAQGLLCDGELNDSEIQFLSKWLENNQSIANAWPGDVLHSRIRHVLADGHVSEEERTHLIETLRQLVGGALEDLSESEHVSELALDQLEKIVIPDSTFCLTGEFVFAPRAQCEGFITRLGGIVSKDVTKKVNYVVVGGLGSKEWKHGSFGTKIEKAIQYRSQGLPICIVHEDIWASSL